MKEVLSAAAAMEKFCLQRRWGTVKYGVIAWAGKANPLLVQYLIVPGSHMSGYYSVSSIAELVSGKYKRQSRL